MNQFAAFIAQMTSPVAASAGGRVQTGAPQGDAFANLLAQFQAALQNQTGATDTTQQTQVVDPLLAAAQGANLSTEELVAKLQALAGADGVSKIDALLARLAPQDQSKAEQRTPPADTSITGLLAALQLQIQAEASQPQPTADETAAKTVTTTAATATATAADAALRGSFTAEATTGTQLQEAAPQPQPTDTTAKTDAKTAAAAQAVENAALAPVVAAQSKQKTNPATPPAEPVTGKSNAKPQPNGTATEPPTEATADAKPKQTTERAPRETPATPKYDRDASAQTTKPSESSGSSSSAMSVATPAPNLVNVQQATTAVVAAPQAGIPLDALAVHVARKFEAGASQFEISLHPADLGKLDISLTVAEDGQVQAVLRAERPETLDLLQRDARSLEQQLRQAGLDVGQGALSFSLSSGNGQRQAPFVGWPAFAQAQDADGVAKQQAASAYIVVRQQGGVDIRV